ncbi:MAG: sigma factor, partial [Gammaproteobacteria bacterium]
MVDVSSDAELVRRFQHGDLAAFEALVQRFQDRVYRLALVWLYDPQYAQDASQEVFLRALKGLKGFRFRSAPFTWLYRATRNVCQEFNRKRPTEPLDL